MVVLMDQESSSSISRHSYHVLLSFRGIDTRKNFTDHLYTALMQAGIRTFRDEGEIERGENIKDKIEKVILQESKISIIVFSKNYASSSWCLNELVKIMEHMKSSHSQHNVLPVFYDVDPAQVKKQTGSYAEAFAKHEESFKFKKEMMQRWRVALEEVADLGGMVLQDRHESQFIQDIVKQVQNKLNRKALDVPPYLVGIDFLVTNINWWLQKDGSNKVDIATICGIGGIGKTTIAKVVYNQNIQIFEGCSFLADVREVSEEHNGLVRLQRQLISDLLKRKVNKIPNTDDGIIKIKEALCCRRVLLVLDDVDDSDKITKIFGTQVPFYPGSKIIITSRHRHILSYPFTCQLLNLESSYYGDLYKEFEVKELSFDQSCQLFNWYAFGKSCSIDQSCMELTSRAVKHCGGLPLALKVLGSSLSGKSRSVWKSALQKLETILDTKIQKILRISYDSLDDDHDKILFLDIACVFIGKDRDYTTTILDGCDFYTTIGIENLIGRSLLGINEKNKLMMHQMIKNMGREIIRQESLNLGKRSRLWHKDAFDVIREKSGTKTVKCLTVDLQEFLKDETEKKIPSLHLVNHSKNHILNMLPNEVEAEAFTKMQRLKLLQLDYGKLVGDGDYRDFPKGLIWLRWHGFPLQCIPTNLDILRVVVLDMRKSCLKHVWKDTKCLPNLKILNLSHSNELVKTPNFSGLLSLEKLILKDCIKLTEVDRSIGQLKSLKFLNLKDCKNLRKLPTTMGMLVSLEQLILSGCLRLDHLPIEFQSMESLRVLSLDETAIFESDSWLSWLTLKRRKELNFFWACLPGCLVKLSLENCKLSDGAMPSDLSCLPCLKSLNLSRNPIHSLPKSISRLSKLKELVLNSCKELESLPKLPITTSGLQTKISQSLILTSLSYFLSLKRCIIFGCEKLTKVESIFKLEPIENFDVEQIQSLFNFNGDCISVGSNKVKIHNYLTDTAIVATPQVIHECDITSCFVPGSEVPISFEHRSKGSRISFTLPPPPPPPTYKYNDIPGEMFSWLNLCIVFSVGNYNELNILDSPPCVVIVNDSKKMETSYISSFIGIPAGSNSNNTLLWLMHWPVTPLQFEVGDTVKCIVNSLVLNIKEFGVAITSKFQSGNNFTSICEVQQNPPGNDDVEEDLIEEDLLSLGSSGIVKVQVHNLLKESDMVASPQVLYDCGIISNIDPSHDDPVSRFANIRAEGVGSKISLTVPSGERVSWLKSIVSLYDDSGRTVDFLLSVEIVNETKHTKWSYSKHFNGIPEVKNKIHWISCWKFMDDELGSGDHLSFTVLSDHLRVKGCIIELIYDSDSNQNILSVWNGISNKYSQGSRTKWSSCLFGIFVYNLFMSQRTLHRIQSLDKKRVE